MAEKNYVKVGGQLQNIVGDGILAYSKEIKDEVREKTQEQINTETYEKVAEIDEALSSLSPEQGEALALSERVGQLEKEVGYHECSTSSGTATKQVVADGYTLSSGCSIKVKMENKNTAASNVKLQIGSSEAKPLYYAGKLVSAANTWDAGEVLDIYYNPNNGGAYYANNVEGGSADGVFDVSDYNKSGDPLEPTKYIDLAAALGTNGNNIPENHRKGGMLIKFIELESLEYKQYRYMGTAVSGTSFTNTANWQGADSVPTEDSRNLVESGGVFEECVEAGDPVGDPVGDWVPSEAEAYVDQKVAEERARAIARENQLLKVYETFTQSNLVIGALPATGKVNTIYRVPGTNSYADYMYAASDLHTPILMATYNNDIDEIPIAGSQNLVKSGGVAREIVWDVTARNSNTTFASLNALLSDANLATLIPTAIRRGGMQIRFVLSSDNNYVQYMYKVTDAATVATFTNVANWQGVDVTPTAGSKNLVESGGVADSLLNLHDADLNLNVFGSARHELDTKYNASQGTSVVIFKNLNLKQGSAIAFTGNLSAANQSNSYILLKDSAGNTIHQVVFITSGNTTGSTTPYLPAQDYSGVSVVLSCNTNASWEITATVSKYLKKSVDTNAADIAAEQQRAEGIEGALQTNLSTVTAEVGNIDKVVEYSLSEIDSDETNTGAIYYYDGTILNYSTYFYTNPIHLSQGDKIYTTSALVANTNIAVLSMVTSNGTWLRTIQRLSAGVLEYTANKDCYICISALNSDKTYFRILKSAISKNIAKTDNMDSYLGMSVKSVDKGDLNSGYRKAADGVVATNSSYSYTNPIQVHKGDVLIRNNVTIISQIAFITKVDASGNPLEVIKIGTGSSANYYEIFDFNGYVSVSAVTKSVIDTVILSSKLVERILSKEGITIDNIDKLIATGLNPLSPLLRECGYGCLLKQWGFIGDSYTSGETPAYLDGVLKYIDMYKWSWGQQFMKIIGSEGYNYSNGGQTAKGWIRNQGTVHDDTYVGGVGGGDWSLAQTELKQGYIISLGINDNGKFGTEYLGAEYTLGDVDTDVDVSDYTNNNENTYAGCYAGIIQRILSVQPKAKIFCMTQFQDTLENVNGVVRGIVTKLNSNNVFLLDMHEYAMDITQVSGYMSQGHPSAYGYAYMAALINTYIDYIIRNNKSKFLDVTLIGTDYSLTQ